MKKYVLGLFALLLIVGFSAFKITNKENQTKRVSYKWFQISGSIEPNEEVPSVSAAYLGEGEEPPVGTGCGGSTYLCVAGFDDNQVNGSDQLIDDFQIAQETSTRKN